MAVASEIVLSSRHSTSSPSLPSNMDLVSLKSGDSDYLSLAKVLALGGKTIKDIECSISREFGDPVIQIHKIRLVGGKGLYLEGEHDIAYMPNDEDTGITEEQMAELDRLYNEEEDKDN